MYTQVSSARKAYPEKSTFFASGRTGVSGRIGLELERYSPCRGPARAASGVVRGRSVHDRNTIAAARPGESERVSHKLFLDPSPRPRRTGVSRARRSPGRTAAAPRNTKATFFGRARAVRRRRVRTALRRSSDLNNDTAVSFFFVCRS